MEAVDLTWSVFQGRECLSIRGLRLSQFDADRLAVFPEEALRRVDRTDTLPPVAGAFITDGDATHFVARFPFVDGPTYALVVAPAGPDDTPALVTTLQRTVRRRTPVTQVVAVYPTAPVVPLNLLRMYVSFSAPMSEGWGATEVQVNRADTGEPMRDVFYRGQAELWDSERRRLTLLLDPGRIKRGLPPHEASGYPLIEGVPFVLSIDGFRDASGLPLRAGVTRRYDVGPPIRSRVDPDDWSLVVPAAGSHDPLVIEFGRPLDQALLEHGLLVCAGSGAVISGEFAASPGELSSEFSPDDRWREGGYTLGVDPRLEDVAGNSTMRPFDRDLMLSDDDPVPLPTPRRFFVRMR